MKSLKLATGGSSIQHRNDGLQPWGALEVGGAWQRFLTAGAMALVIAVAGTVLRAQDCVSCAPPRNPDVWVEGTLSVCVSAAFDNFSEIESAVNDYWEGYGSNNYPMPYDVVFVSEATSSCAGTDMYIEVAVDSEAPGADAVAHVSSNGVGSWININPGMIPSSTSYFRSVIAHEFGHILGFEHCIGSGHYCGYESVMSEATMAGWIGVGGRCADALAKDMLMGPSGDYSDDTEEKLGNAGPEETCYGIVRRTYYRHWVGNGYVWVLVGEEVLPYTIHCLPLDD